MAFSIAEYIKNHGKNVQMTPESIKEAIAGIQSGWKGLGNSSPTAWAKEASDYLLRYEAAVAGKKTFLNSNGQKRGVKPGDETNALASAFRSITGGAQPTAAKNVWERAAKTRADLEKKIATASSNVANVLDIPADASPEERAKLEAKAKAIQDELNPLIEQGKTFGIDTSKAQNLVKTATGYVPGNEFASTAREVGRTGGALTVDQNTFEIKNAAGEVVGKGTDLSDALAKQQQMQGGSMPDKTGAFAPPPTAAPAAGGTALTGAPSAEGGTGTPAAPAQGGTGAGGTNSTVPPGSGVAGGTIDLNAYRQRLTDMGIDPNTLSDQQIQTLGMMNDVMMKNADQNKTIVPAGNSAQEWNSFFAQGAREMDPYFQEQFDMARQDLTNAVGYLSGEFDLAEKQQAEQFNQQRLAQDQQMAEAQLTRSGIRQEAEAKLQEQQRGMVESGRRQAQQQLYGIGSSFERQFGTGGLGAAGVPMLASRGYGELGVGQKQLGYVPLGVELGSVGRERKTAITGRAQELAGGEQAKQAGLTYDQWASSYPSI